MEYKAIVEIGVEAIEWGAHADEWMHRVSECMADVDGFAVTGHKYDMTTAPFIEVTSTLADGAAHDTQFLVLPLDAGVLIAAGTREQDQPDEVASEVWARAASCATARLGAKGTAFEWTALLGPPPVRIGGSEVAIDSDARIGPFRIASAGKMLGEVLPPQTPTLFSAGQAVSWPILVEGEHEGYDWSAAGKRAAFDLHRLAGLLSVALGECLVEREAPAPRAWGVRQVPNQLWWHKWPDAADDEDEPSEPRNEPLPDWLPDAWTAMQARPALGQAVDAHHEGLRAQLEHPSLALVAFIASVEAVSNMLFTRERCSECGSVKGVAPGFRATLRLVTDDATADWLGKTYSPRSRTVHTGQLHGAETAPGAFGFLWNDPAREFESSLWSMRKANRDLLCIALRGGLPDRRPL